MADCTSAGKAYLPANQMAEWGQGIALVTCSSPAYRTTSGRRGGGFSAPEATRPARCRHLRVNARGTLGAQVCEHGNFDLPPNFPAHHLACVPVKETAVIFL